MSKLTGAYDARSDRWLALQKRLSIPVPKMHLTLTPEVKYVQTSLKQQLIQILEAVIAVAGRPVRAALSLAVWAIEKYIPDGETGHDTTLMQAAPDNVKITLRDLFARAVALIPNAFYRRIVAAAGNLVLDYFVDTAWDALAQVVRFEAKPVNESAEAAASAALDSASP